MRLQHVWRQRSWKTVVIGGTGILLVTLSLWNVSSAVVGTLTPDSDVTVGWTTCSTTCPGAGSKYTFVDEGATANTADWLGTGTGGSTGEVLEFGLATLTNVQAVSQVQVCVNAQSATNANGGALDSIGINLRVGGTLQTATTATPALNTWANHCGTFNGTWTQAQLDGMTAHITRNRLGSGNQSAQDDDLRVSNVYATVTYTTSTTLEQSNYRWFANTDAITPGTALATQNTAPGSFSGTRARLQMLVDQSGTAATATDEYRLQYAARGVDGVCDATPDDETYQYILPDIGTRSPTTVVEQVYNKGGVDGIAWFNPGNAAVNDGSNAVTTLNQLEHTNYLKATGFGYSVPSNATVTGVRAELDGDAAGVPHAVKLVKNGVILTTADAASEAGPDGYTYFGGLSDLWGETWTPADINASNFGLVYYLEDDGVASATTVSVDHIRLTVSYSLPASDVRFFDNPSVSDGLAAVNGGVTSARTIKTQSYEEANLVGTRSASLASAGETALWDYALDFSTATAQHYCFRMVKADGTSLSTYAQMPSISLSIAVSQSNYRWYANQDSVAPGTPLAVQNASASITPETPFRLRQRLAVDGRQLNASEGSYKFQYAEKSGTCSASFTGSTYMVNPGSSASSQTNFAGSATDNSTESGLGFWDNKTFVSLDDNQAAYSINSTLSPGQSSDLRTASHGFTIPSNATITGIVLTAELSGSGMDNSISLSKGGARSLDRSQSLAWSGTRQWGGVSDLWGLSWTPADINNANFGAYLGGEIAADSGINIDYVSVTVHYTTVQTGGPITFHNNTSVASGATINASSDPTGRATVYQSYGETDPFTNNVAAIPGGSDGLWDVALTGSSAAAGKTYCFRAVMADGTPLQGYDAYPEITLTSSVPIPTLSQQMRGGRGVIDGVKTPYQL